MHYIAISTADNLYICENTGVIRHEQGQHFHFILTIVTQTQSENNK